jgi:transcriptional regulator with XRE-family HTH domain
MMKNRYSKEQLVLQELLKRLRVERSLTQDQLAAKLNTPQSFISKYESGERHLDFVELNIICQVLELSITDFSTLYEASIKLYESEH